MEQRQSQEIIKIYKNDNDLLLIGGANNHEARSR